MPRNTKKLEMFRRKQEETDDLLREAGMYEEGLSQTVKDQLVQFLEESRESARLEQEERLSQQWQEEKILKETLNKSSSHQRVPGSSSSSSKSSTVNTQIQSKSEDLVLLTLEQPDELECQVIKGGTGNALGTPVKSHHSGRPWQEGRVEVGATASPCLAPLASVSSTLGRGRTAAATSTGTVTTTTTTMANDSTHKALTSATNTGRMQNNSDDDDDDIDIVPPTPDSPTKPPQRPLSPCVVLVPLPFDLLSPRKKARSFGEVVGPSPRLTREKATTNSSTGNTTGPPHSPFLIEEVSATPNSPTEELAATPTPPEASHTLDMLVSPVVGRGRLPTTTTAASSATTTKHNNNSITTTKTTTTKYNKSKIVTTTTRITQLNDDDDIDLVPSTPDSSGTHSTRAPTPCAVSAPHCHASPAPRHNSSPVSGRVTTSSSRKAEKGATPATKSSDLYHNENSFMKTVSISAQALSPEPKVEANSPQPAFSHSDLEEKPILGRQYCPINVFFRRAGYSDAPLLRQRPLRSQAPDTALHPLPNETLEQARARIMALLDSTSQLLLQHKASQLPHAWSLPLTVNSRLRDSLDRPQSPPPRVVARRRPLRERRREERRSLEAQGSSEAPEALEGLEALETKEALVGSKRREVGNRLPSVLHRPDQARMPGLQGGSSSSSSRKKLAIIPLPKVSSDSDTDVETGSIQPGLASPPVPSPPRAVGGTVPGCQPQTSSGRRTFKLLDSDSEGEECYSKSSVAATTSRVGSGPLLEKGVPSPQPGSSDLCLKEQQQPFDLDVVAHAGGKQAAAQRGRRRPATPDLTELIPGKHRKMHTLHTVSSDQEEPTVSSDHEESETLLQAAGVRLVNKWSDDQRQSLVEEEQESQNFPCPMCQKLFPLQHIEVHASDCMGVEEDVHQQQHDIHVHVSKTRRRLRFKPTEDGSKMKRGQGRPLNQEVAQMKEFSEPDSHFGTEDSRPSSPEY